MLTVAPDLLNVAFRLMGLRIGLKEYLLAGTSGPQVSSILAFRVGCVVLQFTVLPFGFNIMP